MGVKKVGVKKNGGEKKNGGKKSGDKKSGGTKIAKNNNKEQIVIKKSANLYHRFRY